MRSICIGPCDVTQQGAAGYRTTFVVLGVNGVIICSEACHGRGCYRHIISEAPHLSSGISHPKTGLPRLKLKKKSDTNSK